MEERKTIREKYSSFKDIKVAVYNIMKGEGKFLEGWLENVKEADYICLLDTGSTDGSYEIAKGYADVHPEYKGKLFVEQEVITPWAFHTARNRNMKMIPGDDAVDVIYSIDLDERVESGFFDELRKTAWENPRALTFLYYYAWSHDSVTKKPSRVFGYNKASFWMQGEIWYDYDVHEALQYSDKYRAFYNSSSAWLDKNRIWLHHWPDQTKSRGSYLKLLEQRVQNYPEDDYGKFYLFRERTFHRQWEEALRDAMWLYGRLRKGKDDMMMLPATALEIAKLFEKMPEKKEETEFFYKRAIEYDTTYRDSYFFYARWLGYQGRPTESLKVLQEGLTKSRRHYDWRELNVVWEDWFVAQLKAVAYSWLGEYEYACCLMEEAEQNMVSSYQKKEASSYGFYTDFDFIKRKLGKIQTAPIKKEGNNYD